MARGVKRWLKVRTAKSGRECQKLAKSKDGQGVTKGDLRVAEKAKSDQGWPRSSMSGQG